MEKQEVEFGGKI